jgi:membrane associated rhomboid family serine protease
MEDLAGIALAALAVPLAMVVADLVGLCMGLGWGYYSKRRRAQRAKGKADK